LAEQIACKSQYDHPNACPQGGENAEKEEIHAREAGGKGYVLTNTGQKPSYKGTDMSVPLKEDIGPVQGLLAHE